jgi:hypothetical protein
MRRFHLKACLSMTTAVLAISATGAGAAVVPPGNSAANQYTEAFPTAGGQATPGKAKRGTALTPSQVLGRANASRLEDEGSAGVVLAQVTAETAPAGARSPRPQGNDGSSHGANGAASQSRPAGSSGFSEVVGQATGSSGRMGVFFPILIVAALIWAFAYWLRRRSGSPASPQSG